MGLVDTYRTQDHADDPPIPHISVHSPPLAHHDYSIACLDSLFYMSDNQVHSLELLYNGDTRLLRGYLRQSGEEQIKLWEVILPQGAGKDWYVGVTGSCGGLWQRVSRHGGILRATADSMPQQETVSWELEKIRFSEQCSI